MVAAKQTGIKSEEVDEELVSIGGGRLVGVDAVLGVVAEGEAHALGHFQVKHVRILVPGVSNHFKYWL